MTLLARQTLATKSRRGIALVALAAALSFAAAALPPRLADATAGLRVGENYRLGNDPAAARAPDAPGLAVNPSNPQNVVAVTVDVLNGVCRFHASFDGGTTWTSGTFGVPAGIRPSQPCNSLNASSNMDGSVAFGTGDKVYAAFSAPRVGAGQSALVARSTDGGLTFETVEAIASNGPSFTLAKLAVRPNPAGDRVYVAAQASGGTLPVLQPARVVVAASSDGGVTWSAPRDASAPPETAREFSQPVVAPDGAVYVSWRTADPVLLANYLVVGKSTDGGATWTRVKAVRVEGSESNSSSSFPRLAVDGSNGTLYLVYGQGPYRSSPQPSDHFIHPDSDVLLVRSTDGGATWSLPVRVNDDRVANNIAQRHPNVSVAPNGRVDVVWHDRRHAYRAPTNTHAAGTEARLGDTYYAYSTDGGESFSRNRRITDRSINTDIGLDYRCCDYWAYGPVSAAIGNDTVLFAWMDSREGNKDNDVQDIYLATLNLAAGGPVPVRPLVGATTASRALALSRFMYPGGGPEAVLAGTFATRAATKVVVVNENDAPGALAGAVLARANLGPLLVSAASGLSQPTQDEVGRMAPIGAYVIGDENALSSQVVTDLANAGVPADAIVRISGTSAADTARGVASVLDKRSNADKLLGAAAFDAAVIANPASPDAASAAGLAGALRLPYLFVEADAIPQPTAEALAALGIRSTLVVGGPAAVSEAVRVQLPSSTRLGGADAAATSKAIVEESVARGLPTNIVYVADASAPVDGALLGATVARVGGLMLLTPGASSAAAIAAIQDLGIAPLVDRVITLTDVGA